jgi:hypothetical protein
LDRLTQDEARITHSPAPPPQISNNTNNNGNTHSSTSPAQLAHKLSTVLADNETLSKELAVARALYERAEQTLVLRKTPHTSVTAASDAPLPPCPEPAVKTIMDLQSQDAAMRKRAEYLFQLSAYQAASVVARVVYSDPTCDADTIFLSTQSTVLAGVESQLLVFFKSSPDFTQQPVPVILQYLLVLTYIALIFSISTTISSLILTINFGNIPMLVGRSQEKIGSVSLLGFEYPPNRKRSSDDITPWQWRLLEGYCTYDELWALAAEPLTFS